MFKNRVISSTNKSFTSDYCQQMDTHLPQATVREALLFSAHLRQPQTIPWAMAEFAE